MEVVAATFGVHRNQDKFIPSQRGPAESGRAPFLCTVALTESLHRLPAGDRQAMRVWPLAMIVGELYLRHGDDCSRPLRRSG